MARSSKASAVLDPKAEEEQLDQDFAIELPYTITLQLRGVTPFLFNRMDIETYDSEGGPSSKRKPGARPEYESMVWRTEAGTLGLPVANVIGSICSAGKFFRSPLGGNGGATTTLREALVAQSELADFGVKDWDVVDFRHAKHGNRARTPKPTYRPRLEVGWQLEVPFAVTLPELYRPAKLL